MAEKLKQQEAIILMIDPYTKEHFILNHTRYASVEIEGKIEAARNDKGEHVVTINATFILRKK